MGVVKAQQRFPCIIWVDMCWMLRAGMLITPTENACLGNLIPSTRSMGVHIFRPSLFSPTALMYAKASCVLDLAKQI
jgi:hypothetical protein